MAYKFAWVQRDIISVKKNDNLDTVDWQLDEICESMQANRDVDPLFSENVIAEWEEIVKIKYT